MSLEIIGLWQVGFWRFSAVPSANQNEPARWRVMEYHVWFGASGHTRRQSLQPSNFPLMSTKKRSSAETLQELHGAILGAFMKAGCQRRWPELSSRTAVDSEAITRWSTAPKLAASYSGTYPDHFSGKFVHRTTSEVKQVILESSRRFPWSRRFD